MINRYWFSKQYWKDRLRFWYSKFENIILVEGQPLYVRVCPRFTCRFTRGVCVQKEVCNLHKDSDWENEMYYYTDCTGCKYYKVSCIGKFTLTEEEKENAYKNAVSNLN